jgi:hypothetical protein
VRNAPTSCFQREATLAPHEFVCADCEVDVFSWGGPPNPTVCQACLTIRDMKARDPMTPEAEAALREILGNVIPIDALRPRRR